MKILVTGGAGFIGSRFAKKLVELKHDVYVLDNLSTGYIEDINKEAKFYQIDILDDKVPELFKKEKFEIVYHLAAQIDVQKSLSDPAYNSQVNMLGTVKILEACKLGEVKKIIFSSSAAVYGRTKYLGIDEDHHREPLSYYGVSKYAAEHYIRLYNELWGLDYTILRYANVYGTHNSSGKQNDVVSVFMNSMLNGKDPVIYGTGSSTRDFIYVDDVIDANLQSLNLGSKETFNIGTGTGTSITQLLNSIEEIIGSETTPQYAPYRIGGIVYSHFNISKAKKLLVWEPKFLLGKGLMKVAQYYMKCFEPVCGI